jgi:hypothetical protein
MSATTETGSAERHARQETVAQSKAAHTPGPWAARIGRLKISDPAFGFGVFPVNYRLDLPPGIKHHSITGANLYEHSAFTAFYSPQEIEANAHLIAAAPDMLAALQLALTFSEQENDGSDSWVDCHMEVENVIRAAIAKATNSIEAPSPTAHGVDGEQARDGEAHE